MEIESRLPEEEVLRVVESGDFKVIKVAICIVKNKVGEILMLLKSPDDPFLPNEWVFPGGGVKEGETPREAALRELGEETKLFFTIKDLSRQAYSLMLVNDRYVVVDWNIYTVEEVFDSETMEIEISKEHVRERWTTADEILGSDHMYVKYTVPDGLLPPRISYESTTA